MSSSADIAADEAPANVVDALVSDACESQRQAGVIPTPIDNRQFVQPIIERMDNKPKVPHGKGPGRTDAVRSEYERRGGTEFESMEIRRTPAEAKSAVIECTQRITLPTEDMAGLRARIRALRKRPEYAERLKTQSAMVLAGQRFRAIGDQTRAKYWEGLGMKTLREIVDESVREFGPWWKPEPKIIVSG